MTATKRFAVLGPLHKAACLLFTAIFIVSAAMTGVLAWRDLSQHKTNEFRGWDLQPRSSLIVTKTVKNADGTPLTDDQKNLEFVFTVTFPDAAEDFTTTYRINNGEPQSFTNGGQIKLKHGQRAVFENLPEGWRYTVTETGTNGYTVTYTNAAGTIPPQGITAAFTNTKDKGGRLIITKTVTGDGADPNKEFCFTVKFFPNGNVQVPAEIYYKIGDDGDLTPLPDDGRIALMHGQTATFENLPVGLKYTVEEDDYRSDGYVTDPSWVSGSITATVTARVDVVNSIPCPDPGKLSFRKTVANGDGSPLTNEQRNLEFTFTVTFENNGDAKVPAALSYRINSNPLTAFVNGGEIKLKHGDVVLFEGLPVGLKYTVVEVNANTGGYTASIMEDSGQIIADPEVIPFVNTKGPEKAKLIITKTVTGRRADYNKEFRFTVTFEANGNAQVPAQIYYKIGDDGDLTPLPDDGCITLKHGQKAIFPDLPVGLKYTVVEDDYTIDQYITYNGSQSGTLSEDVTVGVTNDIPCPPGKMSFKKEVVNSDGSPLTDEQKNLKFTFRVTFADSDDGYAVVPDELFYSLDGGTTLLPFTNGGTIQLKHDDVVLFEDLPNGLKYTIVETDANTNGYIAVTDEVRGNATTIGNVHTFTNVWGEEDPGDLIIAKAVTGQGFDPDKLFRFTVTFTANGSVTVPSQIYYKINGAGAPILLPPNGRVELTHNQTAVFNNLPGGLKYTVIENDYSSDEYFNGNKRYDGTILDKIVITLPYTNDYRPGSLYFKKVVTDEDTDPDAEFEFTVTFSANGSITAPTNLSYRTRSPGSTSYGSPVSFTNGGKITLKNGDEVLFEHLPIGLKYKVEETDAGEFLAGTVSSSGEITTGGVIIPDFNNGKEIPEFVTLTVKKTVIGGRSADPDKLFWFTVTFEDNGIYKVPDPIYYKIDNGSLMPLPLLLPPPGDGIYTGTFALMHGETATFPDLPGGIKYTIIEDDYTDEGYLTSNREYKGTLIADEDKTVTNDYLYDRLSFTKKVTGAGANVNDLFDFKITFAASDDGKVTVPATLTYTINGVGPHAFSNGVTVISIKHGDVVLFDNLPIGLKYTIVETSADTNGYTASPKYADGTITSSGETVTFTNWKPAQLIVRKVVVNANGSPLTDEQKNKVFWFTLYINNATPGTRFSLKTGETKTFADLPIGAAYRVEEDNYAADGYSLIIEHGQGTVSGQTIEVMATNTYGTPPPPSQLIIRKLVVNADGSPLTDAQKSMEFWFTLYINETLPGTRFSLKAGETKTFTNLSVGAAYRVTEDSYAGYSTYISNWQGTISGQTIEVVATNTYGTTPQLLVRKVVDNADGSALTDTQKNKVFWFTLYINNATPGTRFSLKAGETKAFTNLPAGAAYRVEEDNYAAAGYNLTILRGQGTVSGQTIEVLATNTYSYRPPSSSPPSSRPPSSSPPISTTPPSSTTPPPSTTPFKIPPNTPTQIGPTPSYLMERIAETNPPISGPPTGDSSSIWLWVLIMIISAFALRGIVLSGSNKCVAKH